MDISVVWWSWYVLFSTASFYLHSSCGSSEVPQPYLTTRLDFAKDDDVDDDTGCKKNSTVPRIR